MNDHTAHSRFVIDFTNTHKTFAVSGIAKQEAACLELQLLNILTDLQDGDLFAGRMKFYSVGFSTQYVAEMGYFLDESGLKDLIAETGDEVIRQTLCECLDYWMKNRSSTILRSAYDRKMSAALPSDLFYAESGVAFPLCRMGGTCLDYGKLLRLGIRGLAEEIDHYAASDSGASAQTLYRAMKEALKTLSRVCLRYREAVLALCVADRPSHRKTELGRLAEVLRNISEKPPSSFYEAAQLAFLYAMAAESYNYGRMDMYLGDFLVRDLESGILSRDEALSLLISLWRLMIDRKTTWDARVIVGGKGRANEKNADVFALLAIEASQAVRDTLPQLTLRFYDGQDPALLDKAFDAIGEGCTYPLLYNDDVNIEAVERAFSVPRAQAEQYVPFGCGEYILEHMSVGTPSGVINLAKALEVTIFNGYDHVADKKTGVSFGRFEDVTDFEQVYSLFIRQVQYYIDLLARQEKLEYEIAARQASYLFISILYDDCIRRGKGVFDGGVRYLGGTLESYGDVNTADALTAVKKVVFEEKRMTLAELAELLRTDFADAPEKRDWLLDCPKYGNDDECADQMRVRLHDDVCNYTKSRAEKVGLHTYLIVVINNSTNTTFGGFTLASADGRRAGAPLANANNPVGGMDKNGITAFLNSIVKPDTSIHAGSVQNLKLSREMFTTYDLKTRRLLYTYFKNGGAQLMITVLNREDLENALLEPEKYANLMVRVGGFSARFVELPPDVQGEILSRTLY